MRSYSASEPIQALAANSAGGGKTRFSRSTDSIRLLSERLWLDVCPWLSVPVGIFGECLREWTDSLAAKFARALPQNPKLRYRFAEMQPAERTERCSLRR